MHPGRSGITGSASVRAALAVALAAAVTAAATAQSARPGATTKDKASPPDGWDAVSVDISVSRSHVGKDGKPKKKAGGPPAKYRWERSQTTNGWRTSITTLSQGKAAVKSLDGVHQIEPPSDLVPVRIEDDEDGTPVRFYNARGKEIAAPSRDELRKRLPALAVPRPPAPADAQRRRHVTGRDWLDTFVVHKAKKEKRRKGLEDRFGRSRGQVKGLDRFLTASNDGEDEVLVDQEFGVPVELNRVRKGALVSHTTLEYERAADDALVRRSMRTEQTIDEGPDAGDRLVADVQFENLRIEKRGGSR